MLRTYLVTSPSSCGCELGGREGNSSFSPPIGFDVIVTVTVFVGLVCVGVTLTFAVVVLAFVRDMLDAAVAEVA